MTDSDRVEKWIDGLKQQEDLPGHTRVDGPLSMLRRVVIEFDRLRDIVATLPQCYRLADGKPVQDCPVVPDVDTVWVVVHDRKRPVQQCERAGTNLLSKEICANSRECAEALAAKKGGE